MNSSVGTREHVVRIRRVNPQPVIVAVDAGDDVLNPRLATVLGNKHVGRALPNALIVVRIDPDLAVVHRPRIQIAHLLPGLTTVFGTEYSALGVLDDRVDDVRVRAVDVDPYATGVTALWQVFGQLRPRGSAVNCLVESASGTAAVEPPGDTPALVSRGVKCSRALRINCDIDYTSVFIDEQRLRPRLA